MELAIYTTDCVPLGAFESIDDRNSRMEVDLRVRSKVAEQLELEQDILAHVITGHGKVGVFNAVVVAKEIHAQHFKFFAFDYAPMYVITVRLVGDDLGLARLVNTNKTKSRLTDWFWRPLVVFLRTKKL